MLVVHPLVPAQTLQEFMVLARAKPGQLFYASSGVGGPNHLAGESFNRMTGLQITHVPFQGTGLAIQSVISNQVGAMWGFKRSDHSLGVRDDQTSQLFGV